MFRISPAQARLLQSFHVHNGYDFSEINRCFCLCHGNICSAEFEIRANTKGDRIILFHSLLAWISIKYHCLLSALCTE